MGQMIALLMRPYAVLFVVSGLALANLWRGRRETRVRLLGLALPFGILALLSLPVISYLALGSLEWRYPPREHSLSGVGAIVVLAGNADPPDATRRRAQIGHTTLYRCLHASDLVRGGAGCPVLVSGGKVDPRIPGPPCSEFMRDFLLAMKINPSDILVEGRSRTTGENAAECSQVLRGLGIRKVILVTDAAHMHRAVRCFRKQGIEVIPSACRHRATQFNPSLLGFLPSATAAQNTLEALHEWVGMAWYWWKGTI
jgi:uncharacterized SAM-binding protein YcdF (DUF218 family)